MRIWVTAAGEPGRTWLWVTRPKRWDEERHCFDWYEPVPSKRPCEHIRKNVFIPMLLGALGKRPPKHGTKEIVTANLRPE